MGSASNARRWESLARAHEERLQWKKEEAEKLQQSLQALQEERAASAAEAAEARKREELLEVRFQELTGVAEELRESVGERTERAAALAADSQKQQAEAARRLDLAERETLSLRTAASEWQQRHGDEVAARAADAAALSKAQERLSTEEQMLLHLQERCRELGASRDQAHSAREEEIVDMRWRLQRAEGHAKTLGAEADRYQSQLMALVGLHEKCEEEIAADAPVLPLLRQLTAETQRCREVGEMQRRSLEVAADDSRREADKLRKQASELQQRLDEVVAQRASEPPTKLMATVQAQRETAGAVAVDATAVAPTPATGSSTTTVQPASDATGQLSTKRKTAPADVQEATSYSTAKAGIQQVPDSDGSVAAGSGIPPAKIARTSPAASASIEVGSAAASLALNMGEDSGGAAAAAAAATPVSAPPAPAKEGL